MRVSVAGFERFTYPVSRPKAGRLVELAELVGPDGGTAADGLDARRVWEIPRSLVQVEWRPSALENILATAKEEFGLPNEAELALEFRSLRIYGSGAPCGPPEADTVGDASLIGTLVVLLPSTHQGGNLAVLDGGQRREFGTGRWFTAVAFRVGHAHEIHPLEPGSGYRIVLTWDLRLARGEARVAAGSGGKVTELASLIRRHFTGQETGAWDYRRSAEPPRRLVYLLDQEYVPEGLSWSWLRGADAERALLLREAAERAGCETVIGVAEITQAQDYRRESMIRSDERLTHWGGPDASPLEETWLPAGERTCASIRTEDLAPVKSEVWEDAPGGERVLERLYRRAAVVIWPRDLAFANRAEGSDEWALREIAAIADAGDVAGARAAAGTFERIWVHGRYLLPDERQLSVGGLLGLALRAADAVAERDLAFMLLRPFSISDLTAEEVPGLVTAARRYGSKWVAALLEGWLGPRSRAGYGVQHWPAVQLPTLCRALLADESADGTRELPTGTGAMIARALLDKSWRRLSKDITAIDGRQEGDLRYLGAAVAGVLTAAEMTGAPDVRGAVVACVRKQRDQAAMLELHALRARSVLRGYAGGDSEGFRDLAADCVTRIQAWLAGPQRVSEAVSLTGHPSVAGPGQRVMMTFA